jgi:hypothetical protein
MCTFHFNFIVYFMSPNQWVPGATSSGVKRPGREAGHVPIYSVEVMDGGDIPRSPYVSEMCLIN